MVIPRRSTNIIGRLRGLIGIFTLALPVAAGAVVEPPGSPQSGQPIAQRQVDVLTFRVTEPGTEPYLSRMLITETKLRIDGGEDKGGFILFDRDTGSIFSVSREDRTILAIHPTPPLDLTVPDDLGLAQERFVDPAAPAIAGRQPERIEFSAGGARCYTAVVVPGLLDSALNALQEYYRTLSYQQAAMLERFPPGAQTPCDLAQHVYTPTRHLAAGMPVREWDGRGYLRELLDFEEGRLVSPALFLLPEDYTPISLPVPQ